MSPLRWTVSLGAAAGLACLAVPAGFSGVEAHDLPPPAGLGGPPPVGAHPGECYGKVVLPAVIGTAERQELVHEGWTEKVRTPPVVKRYGRTVLVRPARVERYRTPAVYRNEVSWIVHRGAVRRVVEPARYEVVREKVEVSPGHSEWRRTDAPLAYGETRSGQTLLQPTGEIVCRVWIPARYDYVEKKVLVSRGRSYEVAGPSWKQKVVRRVLVSQGQWVVRKIPAVYRTEYTEQVVRPGHVELIQHAAAYRTVRGPALIRPEREGWSRVLCGGAINPAYMARVQQALIAQGFDPGPPDGASRVETYAALRAYQRQHGLAQGQLTVETAQSLGL